MKLAYRTIGAAAATIVIVGLPARAQANPAPASQAGDTFNWSGKIPAGR